MSSYKNIPVSLVLNQEGYDPRRWSVIGLINEANVSVNPFKQTLVEVQNNRTKEVESFYASRDIVGLYYQRRTSRGRDYWTRYFRVQEEKVNPAKHLLKSQKFVGKADLLRYFGLDPSVWEVRTISGQNGIYLGSRGTLAGSYIELPNKKVVGFYRRLLRDKKSCFRDYFRVKNVDNHEPTQG